MLTGPRGLGAAALAANRNRWSSDGASARFDCFGRPIGTGGPLAGSADDGNDDFVDAVDNMYTAFVVLSKLVEPNDMLLASVDVRPVCDTRKKQIRLDYYYWVGEMGSCALLMWAGRGSGSSDEKFKTPFVNNLTQLAHSDGRTIITLARHPSFCFAPLTASQAWSSFRIVHISGDIRSALSQIGRLYLWCEKAVVYGTFHTDDGQTLLLCSFSLSLSLAPCDMYNFVYDNEFPIRPIPKMLNISSNCLASS